MERKLAEELDAAGLLVTPERPKPRTMEFADLANLPYLSWVSKVTLKDPCTTHRQTGVSSSMEKVGHLHLGCGGLPWDDGPAKLLRSQGI